MYIIQFFDYDEWIYIYKDDGDLLYFDTKELANKYCKDNLNQFTDYLIIEV